MEFGLEKRHSALRFVIRFAVYLAAAVSAAWFLVYAYFNQTIVNGNSMLPVLEAGDMCLIDRVHYKFSEPKRFDIILFERSDTGKKNIKRIIALPGETIQIRDGLIYINGEVLENEHTTGLSLPGIAQEPVKLGEDEYFVIGDSADSSEDSRFANFGNVQKASVKGKLWLILKPFSRFGKIR